MGCGELSKSDDRLRLALVPHLEVTLRQRRHQPAVAIRHGDEHPHDVAAAPEHWRLLLGCIRDGEHSHGEADTGDPLRH